MVSIARRKKVTAVLSETRVVEQIELMTSLSAEELSLLETEIVKRLGDEPSDRLRELLTPVRLNNLIKAATDVLSRKSSDQIRRQINKVLGRRLKSSTRRGESHG